MIIILKNVLKVVITRAIIQNDNTSIFFFQICYILIPFDWVLTFYELQIIFEPSFQNLNYSIFFLTAKKFFEVI
jgi:hypothetical protein